MVTAAGMPHDQLELTAHCLLRLTIAVALEAQAIPHGEPSATAELNERTGRRLTSSQWLAILEPHYSRRFYPAEAAPIRERNHEHPKDEASAARQQVAPPAAPA